MEWMRVRCAAEKVPDLPSGWRGALRSIAVPLEWFDSVVLPEMGR
jgi:hypothetical protein